MKRITTSNAFIKAFVLSFLVICSITSAQSQTFICQSFDYYGNDRSEKDIQKDKLLALGSTAVLTFYDNDLKIKLIDNKGKTVEVLFRKEGNEYRYSGESNGKKGLVIIKLEKWVMYIKSFIMESYVNGKLTLKVTFKRK